MSFSIVTPSFGQPRWLRLCAASVADQTGVSVEHIVVDGGSDNDVLELLRRRGEPGAAGGAGAAAGGSLHDPPSRRRLRWISEPDQGMYDAINKGLRLATGDICGYLNCDEQYLPGALEKVAARFARDPRLQVLFSDVVVTGANGGYLCSRQALKPLSFHTRVCHLSTLSAGAFFRRSLLDRGAMYFDTSWRMVADAAWVLAAMRNRVVMGVLRDYVAAFAETGVNMGAKETGRQEAENLRRSAPKLVRALGPLWSAHHRLRRLAHGLYFPKPFGYAIYTLESPDRRVDFTVKRPRFLWKGRLSWLR